MRLRRPGTATFELKLTSRQAARLEAGRPVAFTEKVSYPPDAGPGVVKTEKLKVR